MPLVIVGIAFLLLFVSSAKARSDPNMPSDVSQAVQIALSIESSRRNLNDFAGTLQPDFPNAAASLRAKAVTRPVNS